MLPNREYEFENIEIPDERVYYFYGDNMQESMQIVFWFEEFNKNIKLIKIGYNTISEYIRIYEIEGEIYTFIMTSYYHNGDIPSEVRGLIKEIDKPDVIIYSKDERKVICGIETTASTLAGNATWQRTGRIINCLEKNIPFVFFAYYSKLDQSDLNSNKTPRTPSELFVLLFISLSLKYSTPALVGFYEHKDIKQNVNKSKKSKDWRPDIMEFILKLILKKDGYGKELSDCYQNMKNYYFSDEKKEISIKAFGAPNLKYLRDSEFNKNIIQDIRNKKNSDLFCSPLLFKWKPKIINETILSMFPNIEFYQLSKNGNKAGITIETQKFIDICTLRSNYIGYIEDQLKSKTIPTVIIPTKLTKIDGGKLIFTTDPYNGEISAFSELFNQIFKELNIVILLMDHSKNNEYDVNKAKKGKTYKSISKYANLVIDKDYQVFSKYSEEAILDTRNKYQEQKITEDNITCFFETILKLEEIEPSFVNPPSGSWSDLQLHPTKEFYYYKRNDIRADIAYYYLKDNTYYVGESKENYRILKNSAQAEFQKVNKIIEIIKSNIQQSITYKTFALFFGTKNEAYRILSVSNFDCIAIIESDNRKIKLSVIERNI